MLTPICAPGEIRTHAILFGRQVQLAAMRLTLVVAEEGIEPT